MSVTTSKEIEVEVQNVGGIESATVPFNAGTVAFVGENATNRTSFLTALNAVLGGTRSNLRTDADEGYVALDIDGEKHTRTVTRAGKSATLDGDPYTDEAELVDLYCTLLEDNDIRTAVRTRGDLRDVLMQPIDLAQIHRDIGDLQRNKQQLDSQLAQAEREAEKITTYHSRRDEKHEELEEIDAELEEIKDEIDGVEADAEDIERAEELRDKLDEKRSEMSDIEDKIQYHKSQLDDYRHELEELDPTDAYDTDKTDLKSLREDKREKNNQIEVIENQLDTLHSLVQTAELMQDDESLFASDPAEDFEHVTDKLNPSNGTMCPLCGADATTDDIDEHVEQLRSSIGDRRSARDELQSEVQDINADIDRIETRIDERKRTKRQIQNIKEKISHHEDEISSFEHQSETIEDEVAELESEVVVIEIEEGELPQLYNRQSELEYERGRVESDLDAIESDIEDAKEAAEAVDELEERIEDVNDQIREKRSYIKDTELELVDDFNKQMETLLDELGYDTLERVWLERRAPEDADPHEASFELHIVREGDDGTVYEDTVDTLSESERELIGLILAVAGYEAHSVGDDCPFVLLDSVESIDANRIERLLEHLSEKVETVCVALLPEDADAVDAVTENVSAELLA